MDKLKELCVAICRTCPFVLDNRFSVTYDHDITIKYKGEDFLSINDSGMKDGCFFVAPYVRPYQARVYKDNEAVIQRLNKIIPELIKKLDARRSSSSF